MKKILLAATAALALFASCEQSAVAPVTVDFTQDSTQLTSFEDSVSFVIGTFMANQTMRNVPKELWEDGTINREAFFIGFNKFIKDQDSGIDQQVMQELLAKFSKEQQTKAAEKQLSSLTPAQVELKARNEQFLVENKAKEGYEVTSTGLQYKVLTKGEGPIPNAGSKVSVHYTGKTIEGVVFDSSVDRGQPAEFGVSQVIAGWTEALQFMPVGSKYELVIPQDLAYGSRGAGQNIAPFSTLVFEVELLAIVPQSNNGGQVR
jgi:FKBP-type peptidyl-prolyl cis-trans isomerase FklB